MAGQGEPRMGAPLPEWDRRWLANYKISEKSFDEADPLLVCGWVMVARQAGQARARQGRSRKRHEQLELLDARGMKKKSTRGGKRRGAGRPPKGPRAGSPHKRRPRSRRARRCTSCCARSRASGSLRRRDDLPRDPVGDDRGGEARGLPDRPPQHPAHARPPARRGGEQDGARARDAGVPDLGGEADQRGDQRAKARRRRGQVFADRYHAEIIETPRQARHALAYVLNNWRKHREDRGERARTWLVDPFSTGVLFAGWKELEGHELVMWKIARDLRADDRVVPEDVALARGLAAARLDRCREVPSSPPVAFVVTRAR